CRGSKPDGPAPGEGSAAKGQRRVADRARQDGGFRFEQAERADRPETRQAARDGQEDAGLGALTAPLLARDCSPSRITSPVILRERQGRNRDSSLQQLSL